MNRIIKKYYKKRVQNIRELKTDHLKKGDKIPFISCFVEISEELIPAEGSEKIPVDIFSTITYDYSIKEEEKFKIV